MWRIASKLTLLFFLLLGVVACERPSTAETAPLVERQSNPVAAAQVTPTLAHTAVPTLLPTATAVPPTVAPTPTATLPAISPEMAAKACGQRLPLLPQNNTPTVTELTPDPAILAALLAELPAVARPAWDQLVTNPGSVGLVAYRVGDEANGIHHNADMQMPLASVVKIVHLVAYASCCRWPARPHQLCHRRHAQQLLPARL
ncbi:MAG: hypothetical protein R3D55_24520 [Chloroflexota bacterium]